MKHLRSLALSALTTLSLAAGVLVSAPLVAQAQVDPGLNAVNTQIGLSSEDPRLIAARVINVSLGLLGMIMLVLIIYAGFLWMTSGGNEEQVTRAKTMIRNAIIGVIIILTSWALTTFIINALIGATGGGGGGVAGGGGGPGGGGLPGGPGGSTSFQVRAISPSGPVPIRNIQVRFILSRDVQSASASTSVRVLRASDSSEVPGTISVEGSVVSFTPSAICPAPNADRRCFDADTDYIARVSTSLRSTGGQSLVCGGFAPACERAFRSGSIVDTASPAVTITSPFDGQPVPADDLVRILSNATDDAGVSYIESSVDGVAVGTASASGTQTTLNASVDWDTTGLAAGPKQLRSHAFDVDSNDTMSAAVTVQIRPRHCFNATRDADETGVDCGGSCGACPGGACSSGGMCASGVCTAGVCVEQPMITAVSPDDGRVGTLVSISGVNFGATPGTVTFSSGVVATAPAACTGSGSPTWTPSLVIVSVPAGAVDGPITIRNSATLSDTTNDTRGPILDDFDVNDVAHPGLCAVVPASGVTGDRIELRGADLGSSSDQVYFNDRLVSAFLSWSDSTIALNVPVYAPATFAVSARVAGVQSNAVDFRIDPRTSAAAPVIDAVSPGTGPIGEYITLQGRNFGSGVGRVLFKLGDGSGVADTDFPAECSTAFWSDSSVTVKVPRVYRAGLGDAPLTPGAWKIQLERQDTVDSNEFDFTVASGVAGPGICAIRPTAGPVGTEIEVLGERFGAAATGQVNFSASAGARVPMSVAASDWASNSIKGRVPTGSQTGAVTVRQGSTDSNAVNFAVRNCNEDASICGGSEVCCRSGSCSVGGTCAASSPNAEFAWNISTGVLPINPAVIEECAPSRPASPSPWSGRAGGDRACVNTDLFLRFTTPLRTDSVASNVIVRKCTGPAESPCSTASALIAPSAGYPRVGTDGDPSTGTGYVIFRPGTLWEGDSTYQVILTTGIRSSTDIPMLENVSRCGAGNAYCFTFGTRPSAETCRIGTVNNIPASSVLNELGQTVGVSAMPRAADDICLNLRADAYNWSWNAADSRVEVTNNRETRADGTLRGLENQTVTARAETGSTPTPVNASVTQGTETITGRSDIFVRLQPPRVLSYGPNCDKACLNAAAWAVFNVAMDPASAVNTNVRLMRCDNENCRTGSNIDMSGATVRLSPAPGSADLARTYLLIEPTRTAAGGGIESLLEVGRFYRITLIGGTVSGLRSLTGLPLTGLNAPDGFSWTFRVKEGDDARCAVAAVNVVPVQKFENAVGNRQLFSAAPVSAPDACSATGSPLVSDRSFAWTIDQTTNVSRYINASGAGLVRTAATLPAGCSDRCTPMGAGGIAGRAASCGNGTVETTDTRYCRAGRTPFGEPCTLLAPGSKGGEECDDATSACDAFSCLWKPMTGATCGNGTLQRGEQCDDGAAGSAGCSTTCQLTGSRAGGSTCGNNDVASGEACDDGNSANGDGCNSECVHEGSSHVVALCGNGRIEPGETCESGAGGFPASCDRTTCLNSGTSAPVCGNGVINPGEDCDDGNIMGRDGCSATCLAEGASAAYPEPSFCGDAVRGRGEVCEAAVGGSRPDPVQLAEIVGEGTPDASGRLSSSIHATYDGQNGLATYGLQCGYTQESSCPAGTGLDGAGCCAPRPTVIGQAPSAGATEVCRNVMISGTFNVKMDETSLQTNFVVASEHTGVACPAGSTLLTRIEDYDNTPGIGGFFRRAWIRLKTWFRPRTASADVWCVGATTGRLSFEPSGDGTLASFALDRALAANTHYQVLFRGDTNLLDNNDAANRVGVKSARGVTADGNFLWDFTTGNRICAVTAVYVRDTNADSPNLFTKSSPPESHLYTAQSVSLTDGRSVTLSPVAEYSWSWQPWVASNHEVLEAEVGVGAGTDNRSNVTVVLPPKNGSSFVEAGIRITRDDANVPSTTGRIVKGTQLAQVLLCEVPWPERGVAPFAEVSGHPSLALLGTGSLAATIRSAGPYFNFSTLYCRDAGSQTETADDLPPMNMQPVAVSAGDAALGILRQYLMTFDVASLKGDGIGIRVATNPLHLTPAAWYASRGFSGVPEPTTVDGFEAVKDGTTWYVGGVNTADATGAPVYSQMYIISHNPDAKPETQNIVNQLVTNFTLNANIQSGATNACQYAVADATHSVGELYRGGDGKLVRCSADWECVANNPNLLCASFKSKMQRDSKRIVDFQFMSNALETSKGRTGTYPKLQSGTFVPTLATSRWPSWSQQLRSEVGVAFPNDPVNRFLTCGVCSDNGAPCQDASECGPGAACNAPATQPGVEPATCWNAGTARYVCPRLNPLVPESTSRMYQYRAVNGGGRYELSTELEGANSTRYFPPLLSEIRRCSNVAASCLTDSDCRVYNGAGAVISSGTCNGTGGLWRYADVCGGTAYGAGGGVCGDGVIGTGELCELGDTNPVACTVSGGSAGTELQICNDCRGWINGPATTCVANVQCGNGRVDSGEMCDDGALNGNYGHCNRSCTGYDAFCGDSRLSPGESCDNGPTNGAYCRSGCDASTSCSLSCTGPAPRCGDAAVDEGFEDCDGTSEQTPRPVCVGGTNASNACDTNADCPGSTCGTTPETATCAGVTVRRCSDDRSIVCAADSDCGAATAVSPAGRCIAYPTARTRTCKNYGGADPAAEWCTWNGWSACQPVGFCGDGNRDTGEECDDGNTSNNDSCTNACRTNICGDGFYNTGAEECDLGTANGTRSCTADYGSTCLSCSATCRQVASSGGYCGNGVKEGSEQCDGAQGLGVCRGTSNSCSSSSDCAGGVTCDLISCRSLGYDYASRVVCSHYPYWRRISDQVITCVERPGNFCAYVIGSGVERIVHDYRDVQEFSAEDAGLVCYPDYPPGTVYSLYPNKVDVLSCATACSLSGCQRCTDSTGSGRITGQVMDALYSFLPIPQARVTLYNRGIRVKEVFTGRDGRFTIDNINSVAECSNYRVIVDYYQDNDCTGSANVAGAPDTTDISFCGNTRWSLGEDPDESVNGGYWPYESDNFAVNTFASAGVHDPAGRIFLAPRVGEGETLVVHTWAGRLPSYIDAHLVVPEQQKFRVSGSSELLTPGLTFYTYTPCAPSDAGCLREMRYSSQQGNPNMSTFPHANLYCFTTTTSGGLNLDCNSFYTAPQTMKYKRGDWATTGKYSYYLVDYSSAGPPAPSYQYYDYTSSSVRIVTRDNIYTVDAPRVTGPTCTPSNGEAANQAGKYWLVFQQDAVTGAVTIPSVTNQLRCGGSDSLTNTPGLPVINLPAPMSGI